VKFELWYSDRERSGALLTASDSSSALRKWSDARMIWAVDAPEYAVAADVCAAVLRWGGSESSGSQATVRLTRAASERLGPAMADWDISETQLFRFT